MMLGDLNSQEATGVGLDGGACPLPIVFLDTVLLGHGSGGKRTRELLDGIIVRELGEESLAPMHDGALLDPPPGGRLAMTTDSYVVHPRFFPGGDIGSLAVHGTVNDLAMCGASPRWMSVALILEEGLPIGELARVLRSMRQAADEAGIRIVTGDTKVVERGKGDGIFINTTGVGVVREGIAIDPRRARPGDRILLSGEIAAHGMAIMAVRDRLEFETEIRSDSTSLWGLTEVILEACPDTHVLRDPTRGGIAGALNEIARQAGVGILIEEVAIPVGETVRGACEILGLDPFYVANEGKLLAIVPAESAERVLAAMRSHPLGTEAALIGEVVEVHPGMVDLETRVGGRRVVDLLSGEQLPRIC
jgi:hydrogenase expression/formation protein HypE